MNDIARVCDPTEAQAEVLALALVDAELLEDVSSEQNFRQLLDEYWQINKREIEPPLDRLEFTADAVALESNLRAIYEAAVRDALDLPYERRGEVQAAQTPRVIATLLGDAS
jgi:hypothetical protein